jgi:predicted alpha/beta-hydrolase family hydrolase
MTLVLGHGAGAGQKHPWMRRVVDGLGRRGVDVVTFDFPYIVAKRKTPDPPAVLEQAWREIWDATCRGRSGPCFAGGKSMGGRIASQVASQGGLTPIPAGLVYFGYPLHPPGKPAQRRDAHLSGIRVPMLFLHGTRDPFGSPEEMRALVASLPNSTLELIEGGDHSLARSKSQDPKGESLEGAMDVAAAWMKARA